MEKGCGILLPMSALPSEYGIGTFGSQAYNFIDILANARQKYWQILPLSPTGYGDSPYQSCSAFALSPYYIDPKILFNRGLINSDELNSAKSSDKRVDYEYLFNTRIELLKKAFERFDAKASAFSRFKKQNPELCGYALYMALKEKNDYRAWYEWEKCERIPIKEQLCEYKSLYQKQVDFWLFTQFEAYSQYKDILAYAKKRNVGIIADIPIYVALDSADVWLCPEQFLLDKQRRPKCVAGVPPDYFSADGQLWGNPLYDYKFMKQDGFKWFKRRIRFALEYCSALRIDHFRGFDRFYAVKPNAINAKEGQWRKGAGFELFRDMKDLPIIAEDLGTLDEGVYRLLKRTGYPGMKVLSFAFDSNINNPYKPSNFASANCVAYTGTHDNEPLKALVEKEQKNSNRFFNDLNGELQRAGLKALDINCDSESIVNAILKLLYLSKADVKIVPAQDILKLGAESRINFPSTLSKDNWTFRFTKEQLENIITYFKG